MEEQDTPTHIEQAQAEVCYQELVLTSFFLNAFFGSLCLSLHSNLCWSQPPTVSTHTIGTVHLITPSALRAERSYFNYMASRRTKWQQQQQQISLWLPSFYLFWQLADNNRRDVNVPDKTGNRVGRWHCWLALQVLGGTREPWQHTVSPHPQLVRARHT